jgi:hypothetical protein
VLVDRLLQIKTWGGCPDSNSSEILLIPSLQLVYALVASPVATTINPVASGSNVRHDPLELYDPGVTLNQRPNRRTRKRESSLVACRIQYLPRRPKIGIEIGECKLVD